MKRILVIDDEEVFRQATSCALQSQGFETHEGSDGADGAEKARELLPDLIICDVNMDRMDGYALLETLRQEPATEGIPFILMTGMGDATSMRRGMNLGADDYLAKPFTARQLFSAVEARLKKSQALLRNAEKKLSELRANLSLALPHEMITPLNGIFGLAQILSTDADALTTSEVAEFGTNILRSAERLHRMVQNFLLYGQLEMHACDPQAIATLRNKETAELCQWIEIRARRVAQKSERVEDLQLELTDGRIAMGQDLFTKLVDELLENAFKFSSVGALVRVASSTNAGYFVVSIADRGHGMAAEQIAAVGAYAQFSRKTREQQGSGLGLAIARHIVELHGGEFGIQSADGAGTTVTFTVPTSGVGPFAVPAGGSPGLG
jgi:two-component system, sensor histidine kinase and response regulator